MRPRPHRTPGLPHPLGSRAGGPSALSMRTQSALMFRPPRLALDREAATRGRYLRRRLAFLLTAWSMACGARPTMPSRGVFGEFASRTPETLASAEHPAAAAAYRRACDAGAATPCGYLAFMIDNGVEAPPNPAAAAQLARRACEGDSAYGCTYLGYLTQVGRGVPHDPSRAATLFKRACDGRDGDGCLMLGIMLSSGAEIPSDDRRAAELFGKACSLGNWIGCSSLGVLYEQGRGVLADPARARALHERACAAGEPVGCRALGR